MSLNLLMTDPGYVFTNIESLTGLKKIKKQFQRNNMFMKNNNNEKKSTSMSTIKN